MTLTIEAAQQAVGKCSHCQQHPTWFNNVPLTAYCWGTEEQPHEDWEQVIPHPLQPYKD